MSRTAVVLFNLGGPDSLAAVRPFLFNLFHDPAIIGLPQPLRWLLAQLISRRRAPIAREIYRELGGRSPLREMSEAQARALEAALADLGEVRVFLAMRYWHPFSEETAREVAAFAPERVVLLPLYPQYSTTTSASSLAAWRRASKGVGLTVPSHAICCYPEEPGFVAAYAKLIAPRLDEAQAAATPRLLFSAHGLPKRVVAAGDPYQWQVERSAEAIAAALGRPGLDWVVCYQSRVGPLEWIGPATSDEIARAGRDKVALVVVPLAFVSEHSETLVELDIEYRRLAQDAGVPLYLRVPAVATEAAFIAGLAGLARRALEGGALGSAAGGRLCPVACGACPLEAGA